MKFYSLVVSVFFIATNAAVLDRKYPHVEAPTGTRQCSTNSSTAYVDVILVIDTSANMGNSNLRKISTTLALVLSKFTIGNQTDISKGYRNTRVAIVTYDTQSTIVANFTDINSVSDVSAVLNGLTASNTQQANLYEGIAKAFYLRTNCTSFSNCSITYYYLRPTAMIVFAAAANSVGLQDIPTVIEETDFFDDGTLITVNFNTADQGLTNFLNNITTNPLINVPMYNFTGSSNSLTNDLAWSILQANCYCGGFLGPNYVYYDEVNKRYTKAAECIILSGWEGQYPNDTIDMCQWENYEETVPAFILDSARTKYIESIWMGIDPFTGLSEYPFYIGLHQNQQSQWSWYDYDRTDFPVSGYSDWAQGYPNGTARCGVMDSDDGVHLVWKNYGCNTETAGLDMVLCQSRSCDATSTYCCAYCNEQQGGGVEKKELTMPMRKFASKNRYIRRMKMINGKAVRIA